MNNSKKIYRKMKLTYGGLTIIILAIICMVIISEIIENKDLSGILIAVFACIGLIGLIMFIIPGNFMMIFSLYRNHGGKITCLYDYKKLGVPNNKITDFKVSYRDICDSNIYLYEKCKDIYKGVINNKEVLFDMKGWHNPTYYIYEYLLSILQVKLVKNDKTKLYRDLLCNNEDISLYIKKKSGKTKKYVLISNKHTKLSFKYKERIKIKISNFNANKINIDSLYDFNKD